ncbi:hypothetical protein [Pseudomonas sp. NPDC087690]|jgi:hypothetical protein|uniref:hypothetical protein n=1 Tax=Pseudomonas sp. NPDC087690 TaxID=3364446 RepID=UPI0038295DF8
MSNKTSRKPILICIALVAASLFFAFASLYVAKARGMLDNESHSLCLDIDSSSVGITQLFRAKVAQAFSEEQSQALPITSGPQRVCFAVSMSERFLRWDPNNIASDMRIEHVEISYRGLTQSLSPKQFNLSSGVTDTSQNASGVEWMLKNNDPQTHLQIGTSILIKELVYCGILLALFYSLIIGVVAFLLKKLFVEKSVAYRMSAVTAALLLSVYLITGLIVVGDGAGWDGNVYLNLLFEWKNTGIIPDTDPYRMSRLGGFFPAVAAEFLFGLSRLQLLYVQMAFNVLALSVSAGLFFDYLRKSAIAARSAVRYTIILLLTWPILVMSTYNPLLSDHIAIALSCLSLWLFAHKHFKSLLLTCLISPLIMPGLFLLPLMLLTFSKGEAAANFINRLVFGKKTRIAVFLGIAATMVSYALLWFSRIPDSEILHVGSSLTPGLPQFRLISSTYLIAALILVAWLWSRLLERNSAPAAFSIKWFTLGVTFAIFGHAALYFGLDWNKGFRGPNLLQNMFYQGLNAPFKPILAHFIYFGPCFVIALQLLFRSNKSTSSARHLQIALLGFLPLLLVGSESRQWIAILPFLVAFVAQADISEKHQKLMIGCSVILAAPLFWLTESVAKAVSSHLPMTDPSWQFYFGRQGPWMSQGSYLASAIALFIFMTAWRITRSPSVKTGMQTA